MTHWGIRSKQDDLVRFEAFTIEFRELGNITRYD